MPSFLRRATPDLIACTALLLLWMLFFWRLLTPNPADQQSLQTGDFSGQFYAFSAYQAARFSAGEIPLWNPYNNGGLPFIADTQAAVFYPPRLLAIALANLFGGWSYAALQLEAIIHVLLLSWAMYAFMRRLLQGQGMGSVWGALTSALVVSYGGFITGYPLLQLAILEAVVWFPLAALGILEATRHRQFRWGWLAVAGWALGCSWLAGHPQTGWFNTYWLVAWLGYRAWQARYGWRRGLLALLLLGGITLGTTAITLLPGIEYLRLTSRPDLGFSAKDNGFPIRDLWQLFFPASVSLFSPLYVGLVGLMLAALALWKERRAWFWGISALFGLALSFGGNSAFYSALYTWLPGLSFFRGQERAAYLVSVALAILAGQGMAALIAAPANTARRARVFALTLLAFITLIASAAYIAWQSDPASEAYKLASIAALAWLITAGMVGLLQALQAQARPIVWAGFVALMVFDLFSVNQSAAGTFTDGTAASQVQASAGVVYLQTQAATPPYRVDGFRGLMDNYGSLHRIQDMRGISPLFVNSAQRIIYADYVNNPLAWELFAVRYVFSAETSLSIAATKRAEGQDRDGFYSLYELNDPRPYAHLIYRYDLVDSDAFAWELLNDPRYRPRESLILAQAPSLSLPTVPPQDGGVSITTFNPEYLEISIQTPQNALLSLAQLDYPGWHAALDGQSTPILRAYGALMAFAIPAGEHTLTLWYDPLSYRLGALLSLITWGGLLAFTALRLLRPPRLSEETT